MVYRRRIWKKEEIVLLEKMLRHRVPMREMTRILKRNQNSIVGASKNILIQQCMRHSTKHIAKYHRININLLRAYIVPEKYYITPKCNNNYKFSTCLSIFAAMATAYIALL